MRLDAAPLEVPAHVWAMSEMVAACERQDFAAILGLARKHTGASYNLICRCTGIAATEISAIINGRQQVEKFNRITAIADGLGMPDAARLRCGLAPTGTASAHPQQMPSALQASHPVASAASCEAADVADAEESTGLDSPLAVAARIQWISASNVDEATVDQLRSNVTDMIEDYEKLGPARGLLRGHQHLPQQDGLYTIAAQLSGVLASLAIDLGQASIARAYAVEGFRLAVLTMDANLQAWVRGTQSLIEYYAGRPRDALGFARDGQRRGHGGDQAIRLAVNGEARALARLGDIHGVEEAIARAFDLLASRPSADRTSANLTLGSYCQARTAGNAATAYLWASRPDRARQHAEQALAIFDNTDLRGPQALSRLDIAMTLVRRDRSPDPERAAALVRDALDISASHGFRPVFQRAAEFLAAADRWCELPAVREIAELVHAGSRARPAIDHSVLSPP